MAKVECFNCKRVTPVISPKYRCIYCNYPMHKYVESDEKQPEEEVVKDFKQNDFSQSIVDQMKEKREVLVNQLEKRLAEIKAKNEGKGEEIQEPNKVAESAPVDNLPIADIPKTSDKPPIIEKVEPKVEETPKPSKSVSDFLAENIQQRKKEFNDLFRKKEETPQEEEIALTPPPSSPPPIVETTVERPQETPKFFEDTKPKTEEIIFRKNQNPEKDGKIVAGWLVVHTENRLPVTYELFQGMNIIGRPDGPHHVDVRVEDDKYVSRTHCTIEVKKDFIHRFIYILHDGINKQRRSTNGTYINGLEDKLGQGACVYLKDGDTVQVGETKLAFKNAYQSINYEEAVSSVMNTDYTKTVVLNFKPK